MNAMLIDILYECVPADMIRDYTGLINNLYTYHMCVRVNVNTLVASKFMVTWWTQLDHKEQTYVQISTQYSHFHSRKNKDI